MFSRWASSSIRASTWSRLGTRPSRYACSSSVTSTVLIATPQELIEQGLEGDHIFGHAGDRVVEQDVIQPRGRHGLVQPGQAAIPWLELGPRQARLDLDHTRAKEVKGRLVMGGRRLEMQPDLQPANAGVVPCPVAAGSLADVHFHARS